MGHENSRRCALWVDPEVLVAAQELAALLDVDVDTFIEIVVRTLHDEEALRGMMRSRAARADKSAQGAVIPFVARADQRTRHSAR